jgi:hypothetical protein
MRLRLTMGVYPKRAYLLAAPAPSVWRVWMLPGVAAEAVVEGVEAGVGEVGGIVGAGSELASQPAQLGQPVGLAPF